jgi:hypothetical protein
MLMKSYRRPHRFKKKKSIFKNRFFWLTILGSLLVAALTYFLIFSDFFKIKQIEVTGNKEVAAGDLRNNVEKGLKRGRGIIPSDNILLIKKENIKEDLFNAFPQIDDLVIERGWPGLLRLKVIERQGAALFCVDRKAGEGEGVREECFVMDREGIIFKPGEGISLLPKIKQEFSPEGEIKLGSRMVGAGVLGKMLDVYDKITSSLDIKMGKIFFVSEEMVVLKTIEGWDIYVSLVKDLDWQVTKLKAVLENYLPPEKRKNLEYVELRFGNLAPFKEKGAEE